MLIGLRLGGVALAFIGAAIMTGRTDISYADARPVGMALVMLGVVAVMVAPQILARRWKSRD